MNANLTDAAIEALAFIRALRDCTDDDEVIDLLVNNPGEDVEDHLAQALAGDVACPQTGRFEGDLRGCGSTNVVGPDDEGFHDCLNCGLFFKAEAAGGQGATLQERLAEDTVLGVGVLPAPFPVVELRD